jgi:hypothetical protein
MAWSVPIWKIFGFPKVGLYLERFVLKHATAHIQTRCKQCQNENQKQRKTNEMFCVPKGN